MVKGYNLRVVRCRYATAALQLLNLSTSECVIGGKLESDCTFTTAAYDELMGKWTGALDLCDNKG